MTDAACYAVEAKRAHEMVAARHLRSKQHEVWLPLMWGRRKVNGDVTSVTIPIFPGYLFVTTVLNDFVWHQINRTYGVKAMLTFGLRKPLPIADAIIADLRRRFGTDAIDERDLDEAMRELLPGDTVRALVGPFTGFPGVVDWTAGRRIHALIAIFGRATPVEFDAADLEKVEDA